MKEIKRSYLETLKKVMGTEDIKIITGVRRSGKSSLLRDFMEYVKANVKNANIIFINFSDIDFENLKEYHTLNDYVENHYVPNAKNFVLIDEVQMCDKFELTINSLHASKKYDIYITGSNAFLMASDLATLFTGRIFPIEVFPFSFKEYLDYNDTKKDKYEALDDYLYEGGFAGSYQYPDLASKYKYISDIYDTMVLRDIEQKHHIQNPPVLRKVGDYLMDNIGNLTTGRNITNTLLSEHQETNNKTVESYLSYLCEAFAFYKVKRYDIEGKSYLRTQDKYYLCDQTLKYAKLGTKNINYGRAYENIIAVELLRRGYEVYVGALQNKEIDFVAIKPNEKIYIQASYDITDEKTFKRETSSLLEIKDAYSKYVIARTRQPEQDYEGIHIFDLADWLTKESS